MNVSYCADVGAPPRTRMREIDPIHNPEWLDLVERHPRVSVFHTPGWLEALRRTYGYEPIAVTTSPSSHKIDNGLVACRVSSWLTGRRIVSLPFSDHCEPLVDSAEEMRCLLTTLSDERNEKGWKYVEIRPADSSHIAPPGFTKSKCFCMHRLDLSPGLPEIFQRFHEDCVQRKIRRAEREGLVYEEGRSMSSLAKFYRLLVLTRRRQLLIPQPLAWFRNLIACMGAKLQVHVVSRLGQPVAAMLTLGHKGTLVYKYGCSDKRLSNLGGTQLMFWKMIQNAKGNGFRELDLGRSDWENLGLIRFKDRWGATRSTLTYWRHGAAPADRPSIGLEGQTTQRLFGYVPGGFLSMTGTLIYRHLG